MSRTAGKLAAAVRVLLELTEVGAEMPIQLVWDLLENAVTKAELRAAIATVDELVPASDIELDGNGSRSSPGG